MTPPPHTYFAAGDTSVGFTPYFKLSRLVPSKSGAEKEEDVRSQNKKNKSFVLSGGRKHDRFASGF